MPKPPCASCGLAPLHSIHVIALGYPGSHPYEDGSKVGMGESAGRRAYRQSQAHRDAYSYDSGGCAFEAAGVESACRGAMTKHHTLPKGRAGGAERAERLAPVVNACAYHNDWATGTEEGLTWSEAHFVHVDGRDWPLVMSSAMANALEEAARE